MAMPLSGSVILPLSSSDIRSWCNRSLSAAPCCSILGEAMTQQKTDSALAGKTFYIETFGCQMNVHDSEKVIGTLEQQGYARVETEEDADLILYNTCSIRDKAEQKVFHRLNDYKALYKR